MKSKKRKTAFQTMDTFAQDRACDFLVVGCGWKFSEFIALMNSSTEQEVNEIIKEEKAKNDEDTINYLKNPIKL